MTPPKEPKLSKPAPTISEPDSGLYLLFLKIDSRLSARIGALGEVDFKPGHYAYCGSARRNLSSRISRHMRREKKLRWHVDYLTSRSEVRVESAEIFPAGRLTECKLNSLVQRLPRAEAIPNFGSSDCACLSHLAFLGRRSPGLSDLKIPDEQS